MYACARQGGGRMNRTLIATIALATAASIEGAGQTAAKRPLTIEDYYRVKAVSARRWSDDGRTVTFNVATRVEENNQTRNETFSAPADGSAAAAKVDAPAERQNASAPVSVTSRDGKWI